jgi:hypothetical protein
MLVKIQYSLDYIKKNLSFKFFNKILLFLQEKT